MSARNSLVISFLLFSAVTGRAQQAVPDFSAGFKQLAALGMPAIDAQATWIKHPAAEAGYELRDLVRSTKGNAWLIPAPDAPPRIIPLGAGEPIPADPTEKKPAAAKPIPAQDLTKDVEAILAALKKLAAKKDSDRMYSYSSRGSAYGKFLLFATQLYQNGHPALANQLALAVLDFFPTREAAVDAAIDQLADPLYQQASRGFFSSGDWAAYHQALAALAKRFPRGWASRDAVAIFLPQLEKQAAGATAPAPSLPDIPIDPQAIAAIRQLTEKPPTDPSNTGNNAARGLTPQMRYRMQMMGAYDGGDRFSPSPLWLLGDAAGSAKDNSPPARLAALGMVAIPALAALTADPFLTHFPNSRSGSSYYSSNENSDERTLHLYESLNRPSTRGEIARQFLVATLPDPQNQLGEVDADGLRDLALTFWKEHKSATRDELAAVFLREGSNSQAAQAATVLATSTAPEAHKAFESHCLAADPALANFQSVQVYLRTRKAAARPFFEAYAKLVRSQSQETSGDDDNTNEASWAIKQAGGPTKILKQLEALIGGQSPRALAVQIAKGKPADAPAAIKSLSSLLADATPTKHLHALLEGANAATDPTIRARFLTATLRIPWSHEADGEEAPKADTPPTTRQISEPEAVVWRKLIADTRKLPKDIDGFSEIAMIAATAFENSVSPNTRYSDSFNYTPAILNTTYEAIFMAQATARLAGQPIPPLPDASKISKERLSEIVATAATKPAAQVHPYLSSLTPDERAAWFKWFIDPGDLAYPDSVRELLFTITSRSSNRGTAGTDVPTAGKLDVGFKITQDSLAKHIESLAPEMDKHSRTNIYIGPADFGPGLSIVAEIVPLPSPKPKRKRNTEDSEESDDDGYPSASGIFAPSMRGNALDANTAATAIAVVSLHAEGSGSGQAVWLIQDGKATLQPATAANINADAFGLQDDATITPLATALKSLLEAKERQHFAIQIQILSRADAAKFKAASEAASAPTEEDEEASPEPPEPLPPP